MRKTTDRQDRQRPRPLEGFTLVELVVVVALLGLIMTVLSAAVVVILRNTSTPEGRPSTAERIDDADVLQGLVTWLPQDVDSTPAGGFDTDRDALSGCAGSSDDGVSLLKLTWSEYNGDSTVTYRANYRHVTTEGTSRIVRIACHGESEPFGSSGMVRMSSEVAPLPPDWDPTEPPASVKIDYDGTEVDLVRFEVTTSTGKVLRVDTVEEPGRHAGSNHHCCHSTDTGSDDDVVNNDDNIEHDHASARTHIVYIQHYIDLFNLHDRHHDDPAMRHHLQADSGVERHCEQCHGQDCCVRE